jgi:TIR domain
LPDGAPSAAQTIRAFISYKRESNEHSAWVQQLAAGLRARGIDAILDQWEVKLGESFTDYMQEHIATADIILFVITSESVKAAEAPKGKGGALKFEVQMMNARRIAEGTRIIGVYRSGDQPPRCLRDHRYVDFRDDREYEKSLQILVDDILGRSGAPRLAR